MSPCDTQFKGHIPIVHTQCTPLSNIMLSTYQCEHNHARESAIRPRHSFNQRTIDASTIQTNLMSKFGKENLTPSMLNHHANCPIHTISDVDPIHTPSTTQHIHSGRYTIQKSRLIEHISDDSDEEINKTEGVIDTGIQLTDKETMHICLTQIENMLQANRKSLRDFPSMPYPIGYAANPHQNKLIYNEMAYDKFWLANLTDVITQ
ncbi:hypothetical protein JHK82_044436 [Glycine max]|nr:hypothetical protein JHK85_045401 [Glycine max]KAG5099384.1 hypothetical protein JHK82_044436 [Glycine max]KAG5107988.1 hypothetical protein JHK84_044895 [Glycine max]